MQNIVQSEDSLNYENIGRPEPFLIRILKGKVNCLQENTDQPADTNIL